MRLEIGLNFIYFLVCDDFCRCERKFDERYLALKI